MFKVTLRYLLPIFVLAVFFYPVLVFEVRTKRSDQILFLRKVSPGDQFDFRYIHSVSKTSVSGHFLITSKDMIKPIETQFLSYGPGLPFINGETILEKGKMRTKSNVEEMKQFSFFVSPFINQCLIFKGERLDFSSMKEGEVITVEVKQYPLGRVLLKHGKH